MSENEVIALKPGERLLRLTDVEFKTGLKKSSVYAGIKNETFPHPLKLGPRSSAWISSEIDAWISERIRKRVPR